MLCHYLAMFLVLTLGFMYMNALAVHKNGIGFHNSEYDNLEFNDIYLIKEYHNTTGIIICSLFCAETLTCMSFFIHKKKSKCRLHGLALFDHINGLASEGWKHYIYGENCPVNLGFIHDRENNLCVNISKIQMKADEGKQFCINLFSNLISLDSEEKMIKFDNLLAKVPKSFINTRFRIGLEHKDGIWQWLSGSLLKKSRWHPNEPTCGTNCNCGGVSVDMNGYWYDNDGTCKNMQWQSVCEAP